MRVRFYDHINLCSEISYTDNSDTLIITTINNRVCAVKCRNKNTALELYMKALTIGYMDVSGFEYTDI